MSDEDERLEKFDRGSRPNKKGDPADARSDGQAREEGKEEAQPQACARPPAPGDLMHGQTHL